MNQKTDAHPIFFNFPIQDMAATAKKGRAIFVDQERVKIHIPGDRTSVVETIVDDSHRARWPDTYKAFKEAGEQKIVGMPLSEWSAISRTRVMEFNSLNIFSVEQLAGIQDSLIPNLGTGAQELVTLARAFIQQDAFNIEGVNAIKERDGLLEQIKQLTEERDEALGLLKAANETISEAEKSTKAAKKPKPETTEKPADDAAGGLPGVTT